MSMVIFLRSSRDWFGKLAKILHWLFWSSLNATARWWFSRTDSSLYIRANSESVKQSFFQSNFRKPVLTIRKTTEHCSICNTMIVCERRNAIRQLNWSQVWLCAWLCVDVGTKYRVISNKFDSTAASCFSLHIKHIATGCKTYATYNCTVGT
jgi:hypothetical protein